MDGFVVQGKGFVLRAHGGHAVGDQHGPAPAFGGHGNLQTGRVHVMSVGDDPEAAVGICQRGAHHARRAALKRRHRVKKVSEAAHARRERGPGLVVIGRAVPGPDDHARLQQAPDHGRRGAFGGQRDEGFAALQRAQDGQTFFIERADFARIVRALLQDIQKRPFQMDPEHARRAPGQGLIHGRDGPAHHGIVVADQGRQKARGPVLPVRGADGADRLRRGRAVKQHAAAAVDLQIDKSRRQISAVEVGLYRHIGGQGGARQHLGYLILVQDHGVVSQQPLAVEHAGMGDRPAHRYMPSASPVWRWPSRAAPRTPLESPKRGGTMAGAVRLPNSQGRMAASTCR